VTLGDTYAPAGCFDEDGRLLGLEPYERYYAPAQASMQL